MNIPLSPRFANCLVDLSVDGSGLHYLAALMVADSGEDLHTHEANLQAHASDAHATRSTITDALTTFVDIVNDRDRARVLSEYAQERHCAYRTLTDITSRYDKLIKYAHGLGETSFAVLQEHFPVATFSSTILARDGSKQHVYVTAAGFEAVLKSNSTLQAQPPQRVVSMGARTCGVSSTGYELIMPIALPPLPDAQIDRDPLRSSSSVAAQTRPEESQVKCEPKDSSPVAAAVAQSSKATRHFQSNDTNVTTTSSACSARLQVCEHICASPGQVAQGATGAGQSSATLRTM